MKLSELFILDRAGILGLIGLAFLIADTIKENDYFLMAGAAFAIPAVFFALKRNKEQQKQFLLFLLLISIFCLFLLAYFFFRFDLT